MEFDTLTRTLAGVSISNVTESIRVLGKGISTTDIKELNRIRRDPLRYFRKLTSEPQKLMLYMAVCNVILSGSRAADYFCPGIATVDSDWDFYAPPTRDGALLFCVMLKELGVNWGDPRAKDSKTMPDDEREGTTYALDLNVIRGVIAHDERDIHIQVIYGSFTKLSPANVLTIFHSTIVQCFLSAHCAFCMYPELTCSMRSIAWYPLVQSNADLNYETYMKAAEQAIKKYIARGVKYIQYAEFNPSQRPPYHTVREADPEDQQESLFRYPNEKQIRDRILQSCGPEWADEYKATWKDFIPQFDGITWKELPCGTLQLSGLPYSLNVRLGLGPEATGHFLWENICKMLGMKPSQRLDREEILLEEYSYDKVLFHKLLLDNE